MCLVRKHVHPQNEDALEVIYEPYGTTTANAPDTKVPIAGELVNALRCAVEYLGNARTTLALGVSSADIFIKNIEIPSGLSIKQIEQLSVVEAVSNLPVPPEEICADFIRGASAQSAINECIDIAFCKREFIDELSILAEDAGVSLSIVDRDIQGIHDAARWCAVREGLAEEGVYPLGIILTDDTPTFLICRSDLDLVSFQINAHVSSGIAQSDAVARIKQELIVYCRRAGLTEENGEPLAQLLVIDEAKVLGDIELDFEGLAENFRKLQPRDFLKGDCRKVPLYGLMVATGMSLRTGV